MVAYIVDLFNYEFFRNILIVSIILSFLLPLVGIIINLKKIAFLPDTIGQINMAGVAFGSLLGTIFSFQIIPNFLMVVIFTIIGSLLIEILGNKFKNYNEISLMVVHSLSIMLVMFFLSFNNSYNNSIFSILFGNINSISHQDVLITIFLAIFVMIIFFFFYKKILIVILEKNHAEIYGLNEKRISYLTTSIISIVICIAIKIVGIFLVGTLITIPILIASSFVKSLKKAIILSIIITLYSFFSGITLSVFFDLPTSAVITLNVLLLYFISLLKGKK